MRYRVLVVSFLWSLSPEEDLLYMLKRGTVCSIFKSKALRKPERKKMIIEQFHANA